MQASRSVGQSDADRPSLHGAASNRVRVAGLLRRDQRLVAEPGNPSARRDVVSSPPAEATTAVAYRETMRVYTRTGDRGETSLRWGRRVRKDSAFPTAYGTVDEAQAAIGVARAEAEPQSDLDRILVGVCRDLWVLMAELATAPEDRGRLEAGKDLVTGEMVSRLEEIIDRISQRFEMPKGFTIPGQTRLGALLDLARTVVRRAERAVVGLGLEDSQAVPYLNRLADLLWVLARWVEERPLLAESVDGS